MTITGSDINKFFTNRLTLNGGTVFKFWDLSFDKPYHKFKVSFKSSEHYNDYTINSILYTDYVIPHDYEENFLKELSKTYFLETELLSLLFS